MNRNKVLLAGLFIGLVVVAFGLGWVLVARERVALGRDYAKGDVDHSVEVSPNIANDSRSTILRP